MTAPSSLSSPSARACHKELRVSDRLTRTGLKITYVCVIDGLMQHVREHADIWRAIQHSERTDENVHTANGTSRATRARRYEPMKHILREVKEDISWELR